MVNAVGIRLGTTGKGEVKSDFAEIRNAGAGAMKSIADGAKLAGDAGEREARRLSAAYDRATSDIEAADRRRAAAAAKLATVSVQTPMQARIGSAVGTGFGDPTGTAKQSAIFFAQMAAEQQQLEQRTHALRAALDPAYAAQARFNQSMAEARDLVSRGAISLDLYCQKLRQERALLEQGTVAQNRMTVSTEQAAAGRQQLAFNIQDLGVQFGMAAQSSKPFQGVMSAIMMQGPQVASAVQLMTGSTRGFIGFMGGPWGAILMASVSILGSLAMAYAKTTDEAEDGTKKTYDFGRGLDFLKMNASEASAAMKQLAEDSRNAIKEQGTFYAQRETLAKRGAADARKRIAEAQDEVDRIEGRLKVVGGAAGMLVPAALVEAAKLTYDLSQAKVTLAQRQAELKDSLEASRDTEIGNVQRTVINGLDAQAAATDRYNEAVGRLNARRKESIELEQRLGNALPNYSAAVKARTPNYISGADYQTELGRAMRERDAAVKAAQDASRATRGGGAGQANVGDMTALIKQLFPGAIITSTTGGKHTPGSDHYAGRAIDFVPGGGMRQFSKAQVRQMLQDAGVDIRRNGQGVEQFFGPGDKDHDNHFHVAWQGSASPEAASRRAERDREEAVRRAAQFASMSADLDRAVLDAKRDGIADAAAQAQMAKEQVAVERDKYVVALDAKVALGDLTKAQRDELATKNALVADLKMQKIDTEEARRRAEEALSAQIAASDNQRDILSAQAGLADTASERLPIALRLLDLDKEEERLRLQAIVDRAKVGQATAAEAKIAQDRLDSLDQRYDARGAKTRRENETPMQAYLREIDLTGAQMNERLDGIKADGLRSFTDGLTEAIVEFRSLGDVAKTVLAQIAADLIRMQIQKGIASLLGNVLGGTGGGGSITGLLGGRGAATSLGTIAQSVFPGHASGTEYFSGGMTWLAENGPELVQLPRGAKISNAANTRRMLANDNAPRLVQQTFDLRGAVVTEDLFRQMQEMARSEVKAAAPGIADMGMQRMLDANARSHGRLMG